MEHFVGIPAGFKEKKRNEDAMIYVAMAITPKQWKVLQTLDFNGQDPRRGERDSEMYPVKVDAIGDPVGRKNEQ